MVEDDDFSDEELAEYVKRHNTPEYVQETISDAIQGNTAAGREALEMFISSVYAGDFVPSGPRAEALIWHVVQCLGELLKAEQPFTKPSDYERVLRIDGNRKTDLLPRQIEQASAYYLLIRLGLQPEAAKGWLKNNLGIEVRTTERRAQGFSPMGSWPIRHLLHHTKSLRSNFVNSLDKDLRQKLDELLSETKAEE